MSFRFKQNNFSQRKTPVPSGTRNIDRKLGTIYVRSLTYPHVVKDFIMATYSARSAGFQDIVIDFSELRKDEQSVFPNILCPIAAFIDYFKSQGDYAFTCANTPKILEHTNFMQPMGAGRTAESPNVLNKVWSFDSPEDVFKLVTEYMDAIYKVDEFDSNDVLNWLEWCLNEVMDNVIQHSEASRGFIMGQVHPTTKHIAFCVVDAGRGIYESLRTSSEYWPNKVEDALVLALKEGVTRDKKVGQGNGLWGLHEVAVHANGQLSLASGGEKLVVNEDGKIYPYPFFDKYAKNGTVVDFQLDYSVPIALTDILNGHQPESMKMFTSTVDAEVEGDAIYRLSDQKSGFGTRKSGERIRNEISNMLLSAHRVVIDFSGIGIVSSSFADELVGKMYLTMGPVVFGQKISLVSMNDTVASIVNKAIIQRLGQGMD